MDPSAFTFAIRVFIVGGIILGAGIMGLLWWGLG